MKWNESHSVVSDSLQPHGLYSPWNSLGQNTGVGKPFPSPGDLPNPGIKPMSPALQADFYHWAPKDEYFLDIKLAIEFQGQVVTIL